MNPPEHWIWSREAGAPRDREPGGARRGGGPGGVECHARESGSARPRARPAARTNYLYRGLLHCGICGLRMWGNHRRSSTYYSCQPSHQRAKDIPVGHPVNVYLNQARVDSALRPFLARRSSDRTGANYWRACLEEGAARARRTAALAVSRPRTEIADLNDASIARC